MRDILYRAKAARTLAGMAVLLLTGCATPGPASSPRALADTIAIAVAPCFGFCPVYEVTIRPSGTVDFTGTRHTALLGTRQRQAGTRVYTDLARDLAPFRPATGATQRVDCDAAITDTSSFTISWTDAKGGRAIATHQSGCSGGPGKALDAILRAMPDRLGIAAWTAQVTRPGSTRG